MFLLTGLIAGSPVIAAPTQQSKAALRQADLLIAKNNYRQAIDQLNWAIKADPNSAEAYCKRGKAYFLLEEIDDSVRDLDRAIKLKPTLAEAHFERARVFGEVGQVAIALKQSDKAIALAGKATPYTWYQDRAAWFMQQGEIASALLAYDKALLINPSDSWLHYFRAAAYFKVARYKDALMDLSKICSADTGVLARVLDLRASCYDKLGQPDLAKTARKAAEANVKRQLIDIEPEK